MEPTPIATESRSTQVQAGIKEIFRLKQLFATLPRRGPGAASAA